MLRTTRRPGRLARAQEYHLLRRWQANLHRFLLSPALELVFANALPRLPRLQAPRQADRAGSQIEHNAAPMAEADRCRSHVQVQGAAGSAPPIQLPPYLL